MSLPLPAAVSASLIAVALLAIPACSESQAASDSPTASVTAPATTTTGVATSTTSTAATTSATTKPETPEQQVEAAYRSAITRYHQAASTPNQTADLDQFFTGLALSSALQNLASLGRDGLVAAYPTGLPKVTVSRSEISKEGVALISACIVDTGHQIRVSDGSIVNPTASSAAVEATLTPFGQTWRVDVQTVLGKEADSGGCTP